MERNDFTKALTSFIADIIENEIDMGTCIDEFFEHNDDMIPNAVRDELVGIETQMEDIVDRKIKKAFDGKLEDRVKDIVYHLIPEAVHRQLSRFFERALGVPDDLSELEEEGKKSNTCTCSDG